MRPGLIAVEPFQRLDHLPVQPNAPSGREPVVECVADQDVREAKTTEAPGNVGDDTRDHGLVEGFQQLV